jgi:CTP:molybdopterin cytidylyltransferase MocA
MFSSVQTGVRVALGVQRPPVAVLVWPVDVPLVSVESLRALFSQGSERDCADALWVRGLAHGTPSASPGHPVLLSRAMAHRVVSAGGDGRLDRVLGGADVVWTTVMVDDPYVAVDLDSWAQAAPYLAEDVPSPVSKK